MQMPLSVKPTIRLPRTTALSAAPVSVGDMTISPTAMVRGDRRNASVVCRSHAAPSSEAAAKGQLEPGTLLAERFEILQLLGQAAWARFTRRAIPNWSAWWRSNSSARTRQPSRNLASLQTGLILAREVTHRNVIRIFDLGQAQGIKFITMEYVEGRDLKGLIHEKNETHC